MGGWVGEETYLAGEDKPRVSLAPLAQPEPCHLDCPVGRRWVGGWMSVCLGVRGWGGGEIGGINSLPTHTHPSTLLYHTRTLINISMDSKRCFRSLVRIATAFSSGKVSPAPSSFKAVPNADCFFVCHG